MRRIVINTALDRLKATPAQWVELSGESEYGETFQTHFREDDLLNCLPPASRQVTRLYLIEGYSHREVSRLLGISEVTSRWHLAEARKIFRSKATQIYG